MNAPPFPPYPPFPANPAVGQQFGTWVWNGARWIPSGGSGAIISVQVFTVVGSTLTYIPAPGIVTAMVECVGGGGAGGSASCPGITYMLGGGGGASGGYSRKALPASLVLGGVNVTVGAGGVGAETGTAGGSTSFGALCVATGGGPGQENAATSVGWGQGGVGIAGGVGDVVFIGAGGDNGIFAIVSAPLPSLTGEAGGMGGGMWGGTVHSSPTGVGGAVPGAKAFDGTGAGGSGGSVNQAAAASLAIGGNGGSGLCIVTEYCSGDAGSDCSGQAPVSLGNCGPGWGGPC